MRIIHILDNLRGRYQAHLSNYNSTMLRHGVEKAAKDKDKIWADLMALRKDNQGLESDAKISRYFSCRDPEDEFSVAGIKYLMKATVPNPTQIPLQPPQLEPS